MSYKKKQSMSKHSQIESDVEKIVKLNNSLYPPHHIRVLDTMNMLANSPEIKLTQQMGVLSPYWLGNFEIQNFLPQGYLDLYESVNAFQRAFKNSLPQSINFPDNISKIDFYFQKSFDEMDEEQKNTVKWCMVHGWYPIVTMDTLYTSNEENFEQIIEDFFDRETDAIENNICTSNPKRENIIRDAFEAHRNKKYTLSIPVFLAQSDGICSEKLGIEIFVRATVEQFKSRIQNELSNDFLSCCFEPVVSAPDIRADTRKGNVAPSILNRHHILHGTSTEYPTRQNSLKAISYMGSLDWLLRELDESEKEKNDGIVQYDNEE